MRIAAGLCTGVTLIAAVALSSRAAQAIPLAFSCIASDNAAGCAVDQTQFTVDVADAGPDGVAFIFTNEGPQKSAIARIYVEDARGTLLGPAMIHQDVAGVMFANGVTPANLPGAAAGDHAFTAAPGLGVAAGRPSRRRGVNPGEHIGLVYPLSSGNSFGDVISDLSIGNLRIGIHVVSATANESFVSQPLVTETLE